MKDIKEFALEVKQQLSLPLSVMIGIVTKERLKKGSTTKAMREIEKALNEVVHRVNQLTKFH